MTHTPGSWTSPIPKSDVGAPNSYEFTHPDGAYLFRVDFEPEMWEREIVSNARLIAASPRLLEACERALTFIMSLPYEPSNATSTRVQDALVDALTLAKGE